MSHVFIITTITLLFEILMKTWLLADVMFIEVEKCTQLKFAGNIDRHKSVISKEALDSTKQEISSECSLSFRWKPGTINKLQATSNWKRVILNLVFHSNTES